MLPIYEVLVDDEDINAFEKLYNTHKNKAYLVAYDILHNESLAEECVSETFLSIAKNFKKVNNLESYEQQKYIVISIRNKAFNTLSKEKNNMTNLSYDDEIYFNDDSYSDFDLETWKESIRQLNKTDKEILYLICIQGFDYKEIAESFGISYAAAKQRFWTAKNNLKKIILKEGNS
jgi:RNA polymerase sigma-70 factor (ECF subfamily)